MGSAYHPIKCTLWLGLTYEWEEGGKPVRKCLQPCLPEEADSSRVIAWLPCFQQATADSHRPDEKDVSGQTGGKPTTQTVAASTLFSLLSRKVPSILSCHPSTGAIGRGSYLIPGLEPTVRCGAPPSGGSQLLDPHGPCSRAGKPSLV